MLRSGRDYLDSIRDGRRLFVGKEEIGDTTRHPAFANAARTYAALYDLKGDPAQRELFSYEEDGERFSMYYLRPRTQEDLRRRSRAHRAIADFSYGLLGRSPDAMAGNITGLTMNAAYLDSEPGGSSANLLANWERMRRDDVFATYAIVPPPAARNREYYQSKGLAQPSLRVTAETDAHVVLNGTKMLATGAAFANEVLIGNVMPLAPDQRKEAITCIIPLNLPGLTLWARPPVSGAAGNPFDAPLSSRFDESDCVLVFENVRVPWERVLVHDNAALSRNIYINTPSHVMANHQCNVRFAAKMRFLLGIASCVTRATGARDIPAVRETLSKLAAFAAGFEGMIAGQIEDYETTEHGFALFQRRYLYAALNWAMERHSAVIDAVRELMGGAQFQFPASIDVLEHAELRPIFETMWASGSQTAIERMQLFKLAWDLIGSDLASRATSYEKFFVGPAFAVRNYMFVNTPWDTYEARVEGLLAQDAIA